MKKQRGRKSAASLSVVPPGEVVQIPRPKPPADLTALQADVWRAVVGALPADWFPVESRALLAQYCRHVVAARRASQLIEQAENEGDALDADAWDRLLKIQERQTKAINDLSRAMRLSQHTKVHPRTAGNRSYTPTAPKPWE